MRANTNRSAALAFGKLVDHYDAGRVAYGSEFVNRTLTRLDARSSARLLEVGAGTGQLTGSLLATGGHVVAVEPSAAMADRLRQNHATELTTGHLQVRVQTFESVAPEGLEPFNQIWSSDAWHWIDPLEGYRLAAQLLGPAGLLICTWGFPVLSDQDLQRRLNWLYERMSPALVRDPETHLVSLEPTLEEGRQQVNDSGDMVTVDHWIEPFQVDVTVAAYVDWQLSYAHIAALSSAERLALAQAVRQALEGSESPAEVGVTVWRYTVASRPSHP